MAFCSNLHRIDIPALACIDQALIILDRELGIERQPNRIFAITRQTDSIFDALVAARSDFDIPAILVRCHHFFEQIAETHLGPCAPGFYIGQQSLQISDPGGEDLHELTASLLGAFRVGLRPLRSAQVKAPDGMSVMAIGALGRLAIGWLTMFVVGTDLFVVSPLLPLIAADYQISPSLAGLGVTVFSLSYVVSAPLLGYVADRIGRRRTLTCCMLAFATASLMTASAGNLAWLLVARLFAGAMAAGVSPSVYALVSAVAPSDRRANWMAVVVSGLLVSLSLGGPVAGLAGRFLGWPSIFAILAVLSLPLVAANHQIWPEDHHSQYTTASSGPLLIPAIAVRLAPTVVWSTALYGIYTYLGVGLTSLDFSTEEIARAFVFYGCGAIVGVLIGGLMADRLGSNLTSGISLAGLCVCFLMLRFALSAGVLVELAFGLASAVAQLFFPAQQVGLANDFPARRATVMAWNNSALFLGISLGSLVGGEAISHGSFEVDLTVSASIAISGWVINWAVNPNPARPRRMA
jgi:DHA1 family purine base/nucleoside efflux pump-like MFS transporter